MAADRLAILLDVSVARQLRRRPFAVVVAAVAAAGLSLSGCAAGQQAQTAEQTSVVDGSGFQAGQLLMRDVGVVPPTGASYAAGSTAALEGVLINNGRRPDQLVSVSSPDADQVDFFPDGVTALLALPTGRSSAAAAAVSPTTTSPPTTPVPTDSATAAGSAPPPITAIPVAADESVSIGYDNSSYQIVLVGLKAALYPAQTVTLTFTFAGGGSVTTQVAVKLPVDATRATPTVDTGKQGE